MPKSTQTLYDLIEETLAMLNTKNMSYQIWVKVRIYILEAQLGSEG